MQNLTELQQQCIDFMNKNKDWKDCTSYSQNQPRIPKSFTRNVGKIRITITCGHRDYAPEFVFHCFELGFDTYNLGKMTPNDAANRAIKICKQKVDLIYKSFSELSIN